MSLGSNEVTIFKQVTIGVSVAIFSTLVFGTKSLYDDVKENTIAISHFDEHVISINKKLDKVLEVQVEMIKDLQTLSSNQKLILENKVKIKTY